MALINLTTLFGGVNSLQNSNLSSINFKGGSNIAAFNYGLEPNRDNFSTNPFGKTYRTKAEIEKLAKSSPRIMELLKEHNIPLRVNMEALEDLR